MILAVDQSYSGTGICYISGDGEFCYGLVKTKPKQKWAERIDTILNFIDSFFNLEAEQQRSLKNLSRVEHVIIESYAFCAAGSSSFQLGELGGCIKYHFHKKGMEVQTMLIAHPKMFITGKGNAEKKTSIKCVNEKYGLCIHDDNIADAISIGMTYKAWLLKDYPQDKFHIKLFEKVGEYLERK